MQTTHETPVVRKIRGAARFKYILLSALIALCAGLIAGLTAVSLMGLLRLTVGIPSPVELFGDFVLKHLSATVFVNMLVRFGSHSKTAPLGLALLGMIGVGALLGPLYAAIARVKVPTTGGLRLARREWLTASGFAISMTLGALLLFWNELAQNFLGLPIEWAIFTNALALGADFSLYAVVLGFSYHTLLPKKKDATTTTPLAQKRRLLLARAGIAVLGMGATAGSAGVVQGFLGRLSTYDGMETFPQKGFVAPITPNDEHYTVTQNPIDPTPDSTLWRLEVTGLIGQSGTYTYEELKNLPSTSRAITLECIANGPPGHLISTAIWQGITVRSLLERHGGTLPGASYVAFYSVDGYSISQPLDVVLEADALLAWNMNGVPLPNRHGYPLRALIPGRYGEENPKWLTRIELTDHFVGGLYSDQGWYNGPLHTITRIDRPSGTIAAGTSVEVGGIAFAGNRGIRQVQISVDKGQSWHTAQLKPPLSQDTWVFWTWQWIPLLPGPYTIMARSTDGTGALQPAQRQGTVPTGGSGYGMVNVQVK